MTKPKLFVGILVITKLKINEDSEEQLVAIIQRRGKYNTDNDYGFKKQSFAGLCEITVYGKAEKDETAEEALKREALEEIGQSATKTIFNSTNQVIYENTENDGDHIKIWATFCDKKILKEMKLDVSSGGIELIAEKEVKKLLYKKYSKENINITSLGDYVIFEVPIHAIQKAFDLYK